MSRLTPLSQFGYSDFNVGVTGSPIYRRLVIAEISRRLGALLARYSSASKRMVRTDDNCVLLVPRRRSEWNRRRKGSLGRPARNAWHLRATSDRGSDSMAENQLPIGRHQFTAGDDGCEERIFSQPCGHVGDSVLDRPHQFDAETPLLVGASSHFQNGQCLPADPLIEGLVRPFAPPPSGSFTGSSLSPQCFRLFFSC